MTTIPTFPLTFRQLGVKQVDEIMAIESTAYRTPWTAEEMTQILKAPDFFGTGAYDGNRLVGYSIWAVAGTKIVLHNLAVVGDRRRQGIGALLFNRLKEKVLSTPNRTRIEVPVPELNLDAQLFFRTMGVRAVNVEKRSGDTVYRMLWRRPIDKENAPETDS